MRWGVIGPATAAGAARSAGNARTAARARRLMGSPPRCWCPPWHVATGAYAVREAHLSPNLCDEIYHAALEGSTRRGDDRPPSAPVQSVSVMLACSTAAAEP